MMCSGLHSLCWYSSGFLMFQIQDFYLSIHHLLEITHTGYQVASQEYIQTSLSMYIIAYILYNVSFHIISYLHIQTHACVKNSGSTRVRQRSEQILRFDPLQGNAGAGGLQEPQVQEDGCVSDTSTYRTSTLLYVVSLMFCVHSTSLPEARDLTCRVQEMIIYSCK